MESSHHHCVCGHSTADHHLTPSDEHVAGYRIYCMGDLRIDVTDDGPELSMCGCMTYEPALTPEATR